MQIDNITAGDDYDLVLSGTLIAPAQIVEARMQVVSTDGKTTPIDVTITPEAGASGQITTDGSAGPFSVRFTLPAALTGLLSPGTTYLWGCGFVTSTGRQYSPVPSALLLTTTQRVVIQP